MNRASVIYTVCAGLVLLLWCLFTLAYVESCWASYSPEFIPTYGWPRYLTSILIPSILYWVGLIAAILAFRRNTIGRLTLAPLVLFIAFELLIGAPSLYQANTILGRAWLGIVCVVVLPHTLVIFGVGLHGLAVDDSRRAEV